PSSTTPSSDGRAFCEKRGVIYVCSKIIDNCSSSYLHVSAPLREVPCWVHATDVDI
ncbi:hypothetical protein JOQ06_007394, partial [Pogonophryne albipinna]